MPAAARLGDFHKCPASTGPIPHVGGAILASCSTDIEIDFIAAARTLDKASCAAGPPDVLAMGCPTVIINNQLAVRVGDLTSHGGAVQVGSTTVEIGMAGDGVAVTPVAPAFTFGQKLQQLNSKLKSLAFNAYAPPATNAESFSGAFNAPLDSATGGVLPTAASPPNQCTPVGAEDPTTGYAANTTDDPAIPADDVSQTPTLQRAYKMMDDGIGYNVSPKSADAYSTLGRGDITWITDRQTISDALGSFPDGQCTQSPEAIAELESQMGLRPGSLQATGYNIRPMPTDGASFPINNPENGPLFGGNGQGLPGGGPELIIKGQSPNIPPVASVDVSPPVNPSIISNPVSTTPVEAPIVMEPEIIIPELF